MKRVIIILLIVAAIGGGLWYLYSTGKLPGVTDGAYNDTDRQTYNRMLEAIRASQFSGDVDYITSSYTKGYAPGASMAPADAYGTINGTATMSSGLTKTVWTAWIGTYRGTPKEQAATELANKIRVMWETYRGEMLIKTL